jgi:ElaB/YqjD/DUF883 family membrane-anchored ribosome-binding protein
MTTEPDQIREEIRQTRAALSNDVDALAYKASPSRIVHERSDRIRGAFHDARARIMGTASDLGDRASSAVSDTADSVVDSAGAAATQLKRTAEGNPLAAGVIVFGASWLVSSLLPRSEREQHMAQQVKDVATRQAGPVTDALTESAQEIREHLREPAQHAVESVKATAIDAVDTVKEDASAAVDDLQNHPRA